MVGVDIRPTVAPEPIELSDLDPRIDGAPPREGAGPLDWLLAALLLGAGAIHLALAPAHLAEETRLGWAFLLSGLVQVGLAVVVVAFPRRVPRVLAALASAAFLAAWVASRTKGLPFGLLPQKESVAQIDATCAVLEAVALVLAIGLACTRRRLSGPGWRAFAAIGAAVALIATALAISSPSATAHSHGGEDDLGWSTLQNGQMAGHSHTHDNSAAAQRAVVDMTPATRQTLAGELATTAALVAKYPTLADAVAAGYNRSGPFAPGLGIHYSPPGGGYDMDGVIDAKDLASPMLIFDGTQPDSALAGFMYMSLAQTPPEGFAGPLDQWHTHSKVCFVIDETGINTPFGADAPDVTKEMCDGVGGTFTNSVGFMVHVWTVPGYESPLGTFSDLNPKLTCTDGTYHHRPTKEIGFKNTTCLA